MNTAFMWKRKGRNRNANFDEYREKREIRQMVLQGIKHMRMVFMNLSGRGA